MLFSGRREMAGNKRALKVAQFRVLGEAAPLVGFTQRLALPATFGEAAKDWRIEERWHEPFNGRQLDFFAFPFLRQAA
jgi:hypothetical protein